MIAFPLGRRPRQFRLFMHAFFDDSESFRRRGLVLMAGYLSDASGWDAFGNEWRLMLAKHNLHFLHTSDFLHQEGDYRGMGLSPEKVIEVLRDFMLVVRKHVHCGVSVGLDSEAFREFMGRVPKSQRLGKPEDFCFERVLRMSINHVVRVMPDEPMVVFLDDSNDSTRFLEAFRRLRRKNVDLRNNTVGISFCDDQKLFPLQAADMLACITGRELGKGAEGWSAESPFRDLLLAEDPTYGLLYHSELWDREALFGHPELAAYLTENKGS